MDGEATKRSHKVFEPGAAVYRWRLWVKYYSAERGRKHRHVYWRRVGLVAGALVLFGWLGLTAGAWSLVRYQRHFVHVRYVDLVLPWRWSRYQHELSADYLARGDAEFAARKWDPALTDFSAALSLDPANLGTRLQVGRRQLALGQGTAALITLREGAPAAYRAGDEPYLRDLFGAAFALGLPEDALSLGRSLLPPKVSQQRLDLFVAFQMAEALERLKRYPLAIQLLRDWKLGELPEGSALYAQCYWESGERAEAERLAEVGLRRFPRDDGLYRTEEQWARERKDARAVRGYATLRVFAQPENAAVRLDELYAQRDLGAGPELDREMAAYLADFAGNSAALGQLAALAIDLGRPDLVKEAAAAAHARDQAELGVFFNLGLVEAELVAGDYRRAIKDLAASRTSSPTGSPATDALAMGLQSAAELGMNAKLANESFDRFLLRISDLRASDGIFLIRRLRGMGKGSEAIKLQERLAEQYPGRADVQAERAR